MKLLFLRDFLVLSRCWFNEYQQKYQQSCQGEEDRSAGVQSPAALWSSIAFDWTTKVARSLSVGNVFLKLVRHDPVDCRRHGGL